MPMLTYAVDLDGTLATYSGYRGAGKIGEPIPERIELVKGWLSQGIRVVIFTARAKDAAATLAIAAWCRKHIGRELPVTNIKSPTFSRIYDDRAVPVETNTGRLPDDQSA